MATPAAPVVTPVKKESFLGHFGNVLKKILGITITVAKDAEPIVDLAIPAVAPIYNSAVGLALAMQATSQNTPGTGAVKLAALATALIPEVQAWAVENKIVWLDADITKWASAVVDTLGMIPAPATTTPAV